MVNSPEKSIHSIERQQDVCSRVVLESAHPKITGFGQPEKHPSGEGESLSLCVGKWEAALPRLGILNFSFPPWT